jgi:hypothetical protein
MAKSRDPIKALVQRATTDAAFRRKLKSNPAKVLTEAGVTVEKGVEYIVVEQKPKKQYIVLPPLEKPPEEKGKLSEAELDHVSGGSSAAFGNPNPGDGQWPPPE